MTWNESRLVCRMSGAGLLRIVSSVMLQSVKENVRGGSARAGEE